MTEFLIFLAQIPHWIMQWLGNPIVSKTLYISFSLLYWVGEGGTEGFTWASRSDRMNNILVRPGLHDDPDQENAKGFACYHTWRVAGENLGMYGSMFMIWFLNVSLFSWFLLTLGSMFVGIFFYERVFNYISYGILFPQKAVWGVFNGKVKIPRAVWQDWVMLGIGVTSLFFGC